MQTSQNKKTEVLSLDQQEGKVSNILRRLLRTKGIKKYVVFDIIEEPTEVLPGGIYPYSGYIVTDTGKIYSFWLDWDDKKQDYILGRDILKPDGSIYSFWHEVDPKDDANNPYCQIARKRLGLPYNQHVIHTTRIELASLTKLHAGIYASPPPLVDGLHEDLPDILARISTWNTTITNWAHEYLKGNLIFIAHDKQEAMRHLFFLGNKLYSFRNKTHDQAYNPYIDWESSLSILSTKLEILANLEGKVNTIFTMGV